MKRKSLFVVLALLALSAISLVSFGIMKNRQDTSLPSSRESQSMQQSAAVTEPVAVKDEPAIAEKTEPQEQKTQPEKKRTEPAVVSGSDKSSVSIADSEKKIEGEWVVHDFSFEILEAGMEKETEPKVIAVRDGLYADMKKRKAGKIIHTFKNGKTTIAENPNVFPYKFYENKLYLWNPAELPEGEKNMPAIIAHKQTQALDYRFDDNGKKLECTVTTPYFIFTTVYHKISDLTH